MRRSRAARAALAVVAAWAATAPARGADPPSRVSAPHVTVSLHAEPSEQGPGSGFTAAILFELDPHWHVYWTNPGDSGMEPRVRWRVPEGFEAGPLQFPAPRRIPLAHLVSFGYEGSVALLADLRAQDAPPSGGERILGAKIDWLVCKVECIPGTARLAVPLPEASAGSSDGSRREQFESWRSELPTPTSDAGLDVAAELREDVLRLRLVGTAEGLRPRFADGWFYPEHVGLIQAAGMQRGHRVGDALQWVVPRSEEVAGPPPSRLRGLFVPSEVERLPGGPRALAVDAPWSTEPLPWVSPPAGPDTGGPGLGWTLVGAFAAGLLLNLMPCVLPVLSLKVLSFARAAGDGRSASLRHALAFAFGVVVSYWAVAASLLVLRALGAELGWGFQLQSPAFVVVLAGLFLAMALNLFGVFEIQLPVGGLGIGASSRRDLLSAAGSGVLATLVATPCTAPFMGAALAVALTSSALVGFAVFTTLGLGMAAPYVLLSAYPPLLRRIPAPGPWMIPFKQALGFLMLATVIWLLWVFGHLRVGEEGTHGVDGLAGLLAGLWFVAVGAWLLGLLVVPAAGPWRRGLGRGLAAAVVVAGLWLPLRPASEGEARLAWQVYSPALVETLESAGQPYLLDFTASWCLSCQVNEAVALETEAVKAALEARGIVAIKADWTHRDPVIAAALARHDRFSVPLYLLHPGGGAGSPTVLPNILTESIVLDALARIEPTRGRAAGLVSVNPLEESP